VDGLTWKVKDILAGVKLRLSSNDEAATEMNNQPKANLAV
jgi:hypothetical protein